MQTEQLHKNFLQRKRSQQMQYVPKFTKVKRRKRKKIPPPVQKEPEPTAQPKAKVNISELFGIKRKKFKVKNNRRKGKYTDIMSLVPNNLNDEKEKFFEKEGQYNPDFKYQIKKIKSSYLKKPKKKYLDIAIKILEEVKKHYTCQKEFEKTHGGRLLKFKDAKKFINSYLHNLGVKSKIDIVYKENMVARATTTHNYTQNRSTIYFKVPITLREFMIEGLLNHEIGTHFIRRHNEGRQIWYGKRIKHKLKTNYLATEEGLATINQRIVHCRPNAKIKPYLYRPALLYYAAYMSSQMSFDELYQDLEKYNSDKEDRWNVCVRVKRGH